MQECQHKGERERENVCVCRCVKLITHADNSLIIMAKYNLLQFVVPSCECHPCIKRPIPNYFVHVMNYYSILYIYASWTAQNIYT